MCQFFKSQQSLISWCVSKTRHTLHFHEYTACDSRFLSSLRPRFPDRGRKISWRVLFIVEVVDRDDLAVGADNGSDVAEVASAAVVSQREGFAPGFSLVFAEPRSDSEGDGPVAVDQTEPAVGEAEQAWWVAFTGVGFGGADLLP